MPNTRRAFIATGFTALAGIFAGCSTTQPDYATPEKFTNDAAKAVEAGRKYVRDTRTLPPIPYTVYEAQELLMRGHTDVSGFMSAINLNWVEGVLDVKGKNRSEQIAAAVAIMDGAIDEARTVNPAAHADGVRLREEYRQRALGRTHAQGYNNNPQQAAQAPNGDRYTHKHNMLGNGGEAGDRHYHLNPDGSRRRANGNGAFPAGYEHTHRHGMGVPVNEK